SRACSRSLRSHVVRSALQFDHLHHSFAFVSRHLTMKHGPTDDILIVERIKAITSHHDDRAGHPADDLPIEQLQSEVSPVLAHAWDVACSSTESFAVSRCICADSTSMRALFRAF